MPVYDRHQWGLWLQANKPVEWTPVCRYPAIAGPGDSDVTVDESTCPPDLLPLPTVEEVNGFASPVTDVEKMQAGVQARLDGDEEKRTGVRPNQSGAVPLSRSWAATAMLYAGWHYPTEADLAAGNNPAILAKIYADPTTNTTDKSSVAQKQRALHFTLVMLEGQAFGLDYQAELGAYERTASGAFLAKLALDKRDWLDLPVHTWPSVRAMFADLMG